MIDEHDRRKAEIEDGMIGRAEDADVCGLCGLCGLPGADKVRHPEHWPGEQIPDGPYVHAECEWEECRRAHAALTPEQRNAFLRTL